jgi:hypothetical protein
MTRRRVGPVAIRNTHGGHAPDGIPSPRSRNLLGSYAAHGEARQRVDARRVLASPPARPQPSLLPSSNSASVVFGGSRPNARAWSSRATKTCDRGRGKTPTGARAEAVSPHPQLRNLLGSYAAGGEARRRVDARRGAVRRRRSGTVAGTACGYCTCSCVADKTPKRRLRMLSTVMRVALL